MNKYFYIAILILSSQALFAQVNPISFEVGEAGNQWTWTVFENESNPAAEIVDNPSKTGSNTSEKVMKFTALKAGNPWAGCESQHGSDIGSFALTSANSTIKIMVWGLMDIWEARISVKRCYHWANDL